MFDYDTVKDRPIYVHEWYLWVLDAPGLIAQYDFATGNKLLDHAVEGVETCADLIAWVLGEL